MHMKNDKNSGGKGVVGVKKRFKVGKKESKIDWRGFGKKRRKRGQNLTPFLRPKKSKSPPLRLVHHPFSPQRWLDSPIVFIFDRRKPILFTPKSAHVLFLASNPAFSGALHLAPIMLTPSTNATISLTRNPNVNQLTLPYT